MLIVVNFTLLLLTTFFVVALAGDGVTFDLCTQDSDCRAPRTCLGLDANNETIACAYATSKSCFCVPERLILCDFPDADLDPESCPSGERCVDFYSIDSEICLSCQMAEYLSDEDVFSISDIPDPPSCVKNFSSESFVDFNWSAVEPVTPVPNGGKNGDSCTSDGHCVSPRTCISRDGIDSSESCTSDYYADCICLDTSRLFRCTSQEECDDVGEKCVTTRTSSDEYSGVCISTTAYGASNNAVTITSRDVGTTGSTGLIGSGSGDRSGGGIGDGSGDGSSNGVCIDAIALRHLPKSQLVFAQHRRASVLCDKWGSCATRGHMVEYHGEVMSMGTYCARHVECTRRVIAVNSPKMGWGVRIVSNSPGLSFTALAARYETQFEESALKVVAMFGF